MLDHADITDFFAPVCSDMIDRLIAEHRDVSANVQKLAQTMAQPPYKGLVRYFLEASSSDAHRHSLRHIDQLFDQEGAMKALNSDFWNRALQLTDVLDYMPEKRRHEWFELIRNHNAPPFEDGTVRSTLSDLLASRARFFSERVDGIFQALSRDHVTNCPEGFGKRMILYYSQYGFGSHERVGYINDLRAVIAKLHGRDEPKWYATNRVIDMLTKHTGQWQELDGGALRIRLYKKGTAHLEVHPDIAWKLNQTLAYLHPAAIPSEFRAPPKRRPKSFAVLQRPLPFAVTELLGQVRRKPIVGYTYCFPHTGIQMRDVATQARQVLQGIGGVFDPSGTEVSFDYSIEHVLDEVFCSGCLPDQKSHQFYPTPDALAQRLITLAQIDTSHSCLEPSAGQGNIAVHLPVDRTTCVELSALHCQILRSKGLKVVEHDFTSWSGPEAGFDRIVMNPPFNMGRWQDHLDAAAALVKPGGKIVSVLPSGAKNKASLAGFQCSWHGPYADEFPGTSVDIVILVADKLA